MIRLAQVRDAEWIDLLPGVRLHVLPLDSGLMMAAQSDPRVRDGDPADGQAALRIATVLAERAILDWEGVGDEDGTPLPVTPETVARLMAFWPAFEAFQTLCVAPRLLLDAEGNGSAPLPNGTSAGAPSTALPAKGRARSARRG